MMNERKLIALIGCSLVLTSCDQSSQQPPIPYDDLVQREGKCFEKFSDETFNGKTSGSFNGEVEDGVWKGKVTWFDEEGQLKARFHFKDGLLHGQTERFEFNGLIRYSANFQNGVLDGQTRIYSSKGKMTGEYQYRKGELIEKTDFYPDGQIEVQANYDGGVLQGSYTEFCRDGQVRIQANYDGGTPEGLYAEFKDNGEQNLTLTFKEGRAVDPSYREFNRYKNDEVWKLLSPIQREVALEKGLANGESKHYFVGDKPYIFATWKNGLLDGVCKEKDGSNRGPYENRYFFESGEYLETRFFDSDGKEIEDSWFEKTREEAFNTCNKLPDFITKQSSPPEPPGMFDRALEEARGQTFTTCGSKPIENYLEAALTVTW